MSYLTKVERMIRVLGDIDKRNEQKGKKKFLKLHSVDEQRRKVFKEYKNVWNNGGDRFGHRRIVRVKTICKN